MSRAQSARGQKVLLAGAFLLLIATTVAFFRYSAPFVLVGPDLMASEELSRRTVGRAIIDSGAEESGPGVERIETSSAEESGALIYRLDDPQRFARLRLSAELRADSVRRNGTAGNPVRLTLVTLDGANRALWYLPHIVARLDSDQDWQIYQREIAVVPAAARVEIRLALRKAHGVVSMRNVRLEPMAASPGYLWGRRALLLGWLLLLVGTSIWIIRGSSLDRRHVGLYSLAVIMVVCMAIPLPGSDPDPGDANGVVLRDDSASGEATPPQPHSADASANPHWEGAGGWSWPSWLNWVTARKVGHFALFALLIVTLRAVKPQFSLGELLIVVLLFAATTEAMQFFVPSRTPQVKDFLIDCLGVAFGLFLMLKVRKRRNPSSAGH